MRFGEICGAVEAGRPVRVPAGFAEAVRQAAAGERFLIRTRIGMATRNPRQLRAIYAGVTEAAIDAGMVDASSDADGFDWNALLAFIERLIPLILQLISLFS
jgi:hypothetical protein